MLLRFSSNWRPPAWPVPSEKIKIDFGMSTSRDLPCDCYGCIETDSRNGCLVADGPRTGIWGALPAYKSNKIALVLRDFCAVWSDQEQAFRIVGEDEADPGQGSITYVSRLARALLGESAGELVKVGEEDVVLRYVRTG